MKNAETGNDVCVWMFRRRSFDANHWMSVCRFRKSRVKCDKFDEGGPLEQGFIFCPYCGKPIEIKESGE